MQTNSEIKFLTDGEKLRQWLESVPYRDYAALKRRMASECLVSMTTLKNWIYGQCRIPDSGKRDINRVTLSYSGKEIFKIAKPEESSKGV